LGYVVPHWESVVRKRFGIEAPFVIAADGPESTARSAMNIEFGIREKPQSFLIYEFEAEEPIENEARIVMGRDSTDALWPLSETRCRWTFQMLPVGNREFPEKEREPYIFADSDDDLRAAVQRAAHVRAPWFHNGCKEVTWRTEVDFERRLVASLGHNQTWLVGDAAHQTLPFTCQSMNAGLHEAKTLTDAIHKILRQNASSSLLETYAQQTHDTWKQLLDPRALRAGLGVDPWIAQNLKRLLACLPASGEDLEPVARQLNLQWEVRVEAGIR
jgi:3-(3-hydroxy-phenyl)propionate hydroxylase